MLTVKLRRQLAEYGDDPPRAELPRIPISARDYRSRGVLVGLSHRLAGGRSCPLNVNLTVPH